MSDHKTYGSAAQEARRNAGLNLREAARKLDLSPSYLSKIELDRCAPPSAELIRRMATLYRVSVNSLLIYAKERVDEIIGGEVRENAGLSALYHLASDMTSDEILTIVRGLLNKLPADERASWEAKMKAEFPRLSAGRLRMFAPRVRPRFLSKADLRRAAERLLAAHGITRYNYEPPTPIEDIIENTENLSLHPSDGVEMQCQRDGSPLVLGLTRWDWLGRGRIIEVNENLYLSDRPTSRHRLNYTLAHELWHAVEHLPLMDKQARQCGGMFRMAVDTSVLSELQPKRWWSKNTKRKLDTWEDWQEWQAQTFAAEVLMPHWHVRQEFRRRFRADQVVTPKGYQQREYADELASCDSLPAGEFCDPFHETYDVSRQAMAIRLCALELVLPPEDVEAIA